MPIENLDPGQSTMFTYTLTDACNGQAVRVEVTAARNYAGVLESNLANNRIQAQDCEAQAPVAPKPQSPPPVVVGIDPNKPIGAITQPKPVTVVLPASGPLAPGKYKVLVRQPSAMASVVFNCGVRDGWPLCGANFVEGGLRVGYLFSLSPFVGLVYQTALSFDLSDFLPIYGAQKLLIGSATLSWTDVPQGTGEGGPPSCVVNLSVPTEDWNHGVVAGFVATEEEYADAEGTGSSQWDVLHGGLVASWINAA